MKQIQRQERQKTGMIDETEEEIQQNKK